MAAKQNILYHLLIAMMALNISFANSSEITVHGTAGLKFDAGAAAEHQIGQGGHSNDTEHSEKRFRWPSSVSVSIHRAGEVNSEAGAPIEQQTGHSGPQDHHQQHHHHNHSVHGNDTEHGQRRFGWASLLGALFNRAGEINSGFGLVNEQQLGQNGSQNNHHHHHHHNHSAHGNDTEDGERRFRLPGILGAFFNRAGEVNSGLGALPHHSAHGNDTDDGQRRFRWPSSIEFSIHRAGELSQEGAGGSILPGHVQQDREEKLFGITPILVSCNHTEQPGRTCSDCTHSLICFSNNIGIRRNCGSLYCNKGMCSTKASVSCNATLGP